MLDIREVEQYYAQSHILRSATLSVPEGRCTVLMGRNGVGKTTLLKCIAGLLPVRSGSVTLAARDITRLAADKRARAGIGYVPQGRQIFPLLTVEENLKTGLRARGDGARKVPPEMFELFPVLHDMRRRRGGDLSGGQQQQLAIARALVTKPVLLILDEPTEGIQPNIVHDIGEVIRKLVDELGLSILLVEQKLEFARRTGDAFAMMERGQIMASGGIDVLDEALVRRYLTV